jgi:hypothetical protein
MRRLVLIVWLLSLGAAAVAVGAQPQTPLVFWARGDLWTWSEADASAQPLTADGTVSDAALSPDGMRLAYRVLSPVSRASLNQVESAGFIADYELPTDIWLIDLATRTAVPITAQPPEAALFVPDTPIPIVRSAPAWSPSGDALAWVEATFPANSGTGVISVHHLMSGEWSTPVMDIRAAEPYVPELRWGHSGLAVRTTLAADGPQVFAFFAADGTPLSSAALVPRNGELLQDFVWVWVVDQARDVLGVLYSSGRWALIDPLAGSELAVSGVPALYSPGAAAAPVIRFDVTPDVGFFWEAAFAQSTDASVAYSGVPGRVAVAPDGQAIAFTGFPEFGGLALWRSGVITPVAGTGSTDAAALAATNVYWQPVVWRIDSIS